MMPDDASNAGREGRSRCRDVECHRLTLVEQAGGSVVGGLTTATDEWSRPEPEDGPIWLRLAMMSA